MKRRRGKSVSDRSSNKYGTLISFAPAVLLCWPRGLFCCLSCLFICPLISTSLDLDILFVTHSLAPQQTSRLLVPVTLRNLGSSKLGAQLTSLQHVDAFQAAPVCCYCYLCPAWGTSSSSVYESSQDNSLSQSFSSNGVNNAWLRCNPFSR